MALEQLCGLSSSQRSVGLGQLRAGVGRVRRRSGRRARSYVQFVRAGIDDPPVRPWKDAFGGLIVGSEVFASRVRRMLEGRLAAADVPQLRALRPRPDLKRIAAVVAEHFGGCGADWTAGRRSDDAGRAVAAYLAQSALRLSGDRSGGNLGLPSA